MQVETTRFGMLDLDPEQVITFTQPIIGFQDNRRYVIVPGPEDSVVLWLQSTENGQLAFLLMDPRHALPDYRVEISKFDLTELAAADENDIEVYTTVVVPEDPALVRTNLKAPILINRKQRLAKQIVCERSDYPIQFFLARDRQDAPAGGR